MDDVHSKPPVSMHVGGTCKGNAKQAATHPIPVEIARFVKFTSVEDGQRYVVIEGSKRRGLRGRVTGIIGFRHASGYEVILQLDSGRLDSFAPMSLVPEIHRK